MKSADSAKAFGVALASLVITMIASFPMVAFYAYFIEPGHPQEFYTDAAQWIAPWSSYILGPIVFFQFNFRLARRTPDRNAMLFAIACIGAYVLIELVMILAMNLDFQMFLTVSMAFWLSVKLIAAVLGAHLGIKDKQIID